MMGRFTGKKFYLFFFFFFFFGVHVSCKGICPYGQIIVFFSPFFLLFFSHFFSFHVIVISGRR